MSQTTYFLSKQLLCIIFLLVFTSSVQAQADKDTETETIEAAQLQETLSTLNSFVTLQSDLTKDIKSVGRQLKSAKSETDKKTLQAQLEKLETDLLATRTNFENIAAGSSVFSLRAKEEKPFKFQEEIFSLLKPALKEMKEMTTHVRQKSELKDKIAYNKEKLPIIQNAVKNLTMHLEGSRSKSLKKQLKAMLVEWQKQLTFFESELQAAELQLEKLQSSETSIAEASESYFKSFFQKRGLYLAQALLVVLGVLLVSRLTYKVIVRVIPGYRRKHRSFRVRLLDLTHRIVTTILTIIGPMLVFYLVEDWVLFSLGVLLLLGIGWTVRRALPRYWSQIQLFLNIGSVREGERIFIDGLPWRVKQINIYSTLDNPTANISQRIPIDDLVDLKSRPANKDEPWFPCKKDDWVILSDEMRGKITGISQEMVELVERGGVTRTYLTSDFLSLSPRNLSTNFRIKETIGISYNLQQESISSIPKLLHSHLEKRLGEEGYGDQLLNLRVEFQEANTSSLDIVVMADFKGELGDLYNRLRRAIQRLSVEACTINGWEIPFPQLTVHGVEQQSN